VTQQQYQADEIEDAHELTGHCQKLKLKKPTYLRHLPNCACAQFHHLLQTVFSAWPEEGS